MARLVALDAAGAPFVDALQRAWADGDAVLPVDPRLPAPAARPSWRRRGSTSRPRTATRWSSPPAARSGEPKLVVLTHAAVEASARATSARLDIDPDAGPLARVPAAVARRRAVRRHPVAASPARRAPCTTGFDAAAVIARGGGRAAPARRSCPPRSPASTRRRSARSSSADRRRPPIDRPTSSPPTASPRPAAASSTTASRSTAWRSASSTARSRCGARCSSARTATATTRRTPTAGCRPATPASFEDGRLTVHGRVGDLIITGGENVWPVAVERVLSTHPGVAEVVVVGRAGPEWGQRVVAIVVPRDPRAPPSLDDLRAHAKELLPAYAAPKERRARRRRCRRTASGKVRRGLGRDDEHRLDAAAADESGAPRRATSRPSERIRRSPPVPSVRRASPRSPGRHCGAGDTSRCRLRVDLAERLPIGSEEQQSRGLERDLRVLHDGGPTVGGLDRSRGTRRQGPGSRPEHPR